MTIDSTKNKYYFISFWLIIIFHLVNNYFWLQQSTDIVGVDVANHLFFQLKFHRILNFIVSNQYIPLFIKVRQFFKLMNTSMASPDCIYWPNFVYFSSSLFSLIFGDSLFIVKLSMLVYFLILLFSTYAITKEIGNKQTGLLAITLVGMYPLIFESSRQYGLDFPLTAIVTLSILLLLKTNHFTNFYFSILLGIFAGIGMLIKGQFMLFFILPSILILSNYFFKKSENKFSEKILLNIILFFAIVVLITSIWWFNKARIAIGLLIEHIISHNKFLEGGTVDKIYSLDFYLHHFKTLFFNSMGVIFSVLFLLSMFYFIKNKVKYKSLLICSIFIPLLLFSIFFVIKHDRFLMPILPMIAIISARYMQQIKQKKFKMTIIFLFILLGLLQYYTLSYYRKLDKDNFIFKKISPILGYSSYGYINSAHNILPYYDFEKLKLTKEVASEINKDCTDNNCKIGTIVTAGHMTTAEILYWLYYWNPNLYILDWIEQYHSFYKELPNLSYVVLISYKSDGFSWPRDNNFLKLIGKYNFINLRLCQTLLDWNDNFNRLSMFESKFYLLKSIEFSNGLYWYIYKRKS